MSGLGFFREQITKRRYECHLEYPFGPVQDPVTFDSYAEAVGYGKGFVDSADLLAQEDVTYEVKSVE